MISMTSASNYTITAMITINLLDFVKSSLLSQNMPTGVGHFQHKKAILCHRAISCHRRVECVKTVVTG